jgi:hypothetical protein
MKRLEGTISRDILTVWGGPRAGLYQFIAVK